MAKKKQNLSPEELLEQALVPEQEWPYEVPENWGWAYFLSVTINKDSIRIPLSQTQRANIYKIYDYYGASGVIDKVDKFLFDKRLLLIGEDGANLITRSKPIAFIAEGKYWVNNHAHVVDVKNCILMDYLCNYINLIDLAPYVTGSAQPKMTQEKMGTISIPLPPITEQKRIVDRIESLFEKLDQAKGLIQDALDSFENRKAAILHKAFSGELTKKWREENGVGMESWEEKTLGEIIKVSSGQGLTSQNMNPEGRIPVYGGNGITGYHDKSTVNIPTIVIGRVGFYCGSVHFINEPAWVTDNALIARFDERNINITFLYWLLSHTDLRKNESSTAQPVISGSKIYPTVVKVPSYSEQLEIVTIIESVLANEKVAKEFCDIVESIQLMKKSILARAFRGELATNNSSEESAIHLLEKMFAENGGELK